MTVELVPHRFPIRVYYEDTDAGGVVYHANYLRFAERARTEMLRDLGYPHSQLTARHGLAFVVARVEIDYLSPARLDESLQVVTNVQAVGRSSIRLSQDIVAADGVARAKILARLVAVNAEGRPTALPDDFLHTTGLAAGLNKI